MKFLDSQELVEFVKERQAHEVRGLRQARGLEPKLAAGGLPKEFLPEIREYGEDILVDVAENEAAGEVSQAYVTAI